MKSYIANLSLAPVWAGMAVVMLSLSWQLPNHSNPWLAFHADALAATVLAVVGVVRMIKAQHPPALNILNLVLLALAAVPWLQWLGGQLAFVGQAWTGSIYVWGLLFSMLVGQYWAGQSWSQMGDLLFMSVGLAALLSVGMALKQWLGLDQYEALNFWVMNISGGRPYANMAQPNQLATLLLWGVLACMWGLFRTKLSGWTALCLALFFTLGIALTQSRSAGLGLAAFVAFSFRWRKGLYSREAARLVDTRKLVWASTALLVFYAVLLVSMNAISRHLLLPEVLAVGDRIGQGLRPQAWRMFIQASLEQPWTGYGWNQTLAAHFAVADDFPALSTPFAQAHNLVIDLLLWLGLPAGLSLSALFLYAFTIMVRRTATVEQAVFILFISAVGIHGMLEFPLYYAYFLLPTGLVWGYLAADMQIFRLRMVPSGVTSALAWAVALTAVLALALTVRDYFRVEAEFLALEIQRARIQNSRPVSVPDLWVLTDQAEIQRFMSYTPTSDATQNQLALANAVILQMASTQNILKTAVLLGINHRPDEAARLLVKMCKIVPPSQCLSATQQWQNHITTHPVLAGVNWVDAQK